MEDAEKKGNEFTIGAGKMNLIAIFIIAPITFALFLLPFLLLWNYELFEIGKKQAMSHFILIMVLGILFHEVLHGVGFAIHASSGLKSVRFGINWKYLAPYCHCKEPVKVKHYRFAGALPLIVMGIIPSVIGIAIGNGFLLSIGIVYTWAAAGDIILLFMLRNINRNTLVADHPDKLGFCIVDSD